MLSFIQQIRKTVYIQTILPIIAYISNKSGASGVQHFLTPLPPSAPFYTHARKQINVASYHVLKSFSSKKNAEVLRAGPLTRPGPPGAGGSKGGSAGPAFTHINGIKIKCGY